MDSVTVDGNKVALRQFVHARIPEEKRKKRITGFVPLVKVTSSRMMSSCLLNLVKTTWQTLS